MTSLKKLSTYASAVNTQSIVDKIYWYWKPDDTRKRGKAVALITPYIKLCKVIGTDTLMELQKNLNTPILNMVLVGGTGTIILLHVGFSLHII